MTHPCDALSQVTTKPFVFNFVFLYHAFVWLRGSYVMRLSRNLSWLHKFTCYTYDIQHICHEPQAISGIYATKSYIRLFKDGKFKQIIGSCADDKQEVCQRLYVVVRADFWGSCKIIHIRWALVMDFQMHFSPRLKGLAANELQFCGFLLSSAAPSFSM